MVYVAVQQYPLWTSGGSLVGIWGPSGKVVSSAPVCREVCQIVSTLWTPSTNDLYVFSDTSDPGPTQNYPSWENLTIFSPSMNQGVDTVALGQNGSSGVVVYDPSTNDLWALMEGPHDDNPSCYLQEISANGTLLTQVPVGWQARDLVFDPDNGALYVQDGFPVQGEVDPTGTLVVSGWTGQTLGSLPDLGNGPAVDLATGDLYFSDEPLPVSLPGTVDVYQGGFASGPPNATVSLGNGAEGEAMVVVGVLGLIAISSALAVMMRGDGEASPGPKDPP